VKNLALEAWEARRAKQLKDVLRENPELRERAKALGVWLDTIAEIEAEEE